MVVRTSVLALALILLCGTVFTAIALVARQGPHASRVTQDRRLEDAISTLSSSTSPTVPDTTAARSPTPFPQTANVRRRDDLDDRLDAAEARARMEANIAVLDARFASEARDTGWAVREEQSLRAFFDTDTLATKGLAAPSDLKTACHGFTCRVSARFTDPIDAEMTTTHLMIDLGARLPYAAVTPRTLDDGSLQIDAWYSSQRIAL